MSKLKSILLLCALAGGAYLWFQLSNLHIAIGERATGGYDGASTRSPEDVDRAVREAEEAAAKAQAARPEAQRGNRPGRVRPGRARVTLRGRRHPADPARAGIHVQQIAIGHGIEDAGHAGQRGMPNSRATMAPWDR